MSLFTLRTGATAHPEDSVLQFTTDFIAVSGVVSRATGTTHFLVQAQASPDMTVKVKAGRAYIKGSSGNAYPIISDADTSVAISSNGSGSTRVDALVLYIDKSASANSDASNVAKLAIVQGTTSAPNDATVQAAVGASNPFLRLANISVGSGVTSITGGNITDTRTTAKFQLSDLAVQDGMYDLKEATSSPSAPAAGFERIYSKSDKKLYRQTSDAIEHELIPNTENVLQNGNFINASTNGYGGVPDEWANSSLASVIQGGFPELTKQQLIDLLGITNSDVQGFWNLNGNFTDLSSNGYNLTATNSPTDVSDGLMAQAKSFARSSSQYAINSSSPNLLITGSQTWFCLFKANSLPGNMNMMGHGDSTPTNYAQLFVDVNNNIGFKLTGVTGGVLPSDVVVQAGKWYLAVGRYNSVTGKFSVTVNGIYKETPASGSHGVSGTQAFALARIGNYNNEYFDGVIQCAGVLSVALTDDQLKRLWAATTYKGVKIRRSTSNGYISQDLPPDMVERLRGKTLTLRGEMYQEVASAGQLEIYDGTATTSSTDATTAAWLEKSVTKTISATATQIQIRLKHSTTDGNTWLRKTALFEGGQALPYEPSAYDWAKFPLLLLQSPSVVRDGYDFAGNILAYLEGTGSQNMSGAAVDLNGLTAQIIIPSGGRRVRVTFQAHWQNNTNSDSVGQANLVEDGNTVRTVTTPITSGGISITGAASVYTKFLSAGLHTYKLQGNKTTGTGTVILNVAGNTTPFLLIELA